MSRLKAEDYAMLERSYIPDSLAEEAGLYRVSSLDGAALVGYRNGDASGIVFTYFKPGTRDVLAERLRLDYPPVDSITGKPQFKYRSAPGSRNRFYFPPCDPELLNDPTLAIVFTEGEKKALALWRAALELGFAGKLAFLPIGLAGVWAWRGTIGHQTSANGHPVPQRGPLIDFEFLAWKNRRVTILFDSNTLTNPKVMTARLRLADELTRRQAMVWLCDLPQYVGVNGVDDLLYHFGLQSFQEVFETAHRFEWRQELMLSDKMKPLACLANAITALRSAPEWCGVLAWDQFSLRVVASLPAPWGIARPWTDYHDLRTTEWLQRHGIMIKLPEAGRAVQTVAQQRQFHPVRQYLEGLVWDHQPRIDTWLINYLGAKDEPLTRAIGRKWLISAVARIYSPGCKADSCLILEGEQATGKSTALRILGDPWYSDDVAELGTKDAPIGTRGKWILEFAELDSIAHASPSKIKAFISRAVDRLRLPYAQRADDFPRECVFSGTVNHGDYLRDETGARRFWPVQCGNIDLLSLQRDRDQLWAESVNCFNLKENWWLDSPELNSAAIEEQDARYDDDPWTSSVAIWLLNHSDISISEILSGAIRKDPSFWQQSDKIRISKILTRLGFKRYNKRIGQTREWRYRVV